MDEMLEKFCAPPGNHKQALFPSSGLEKDLIPPFLGLNQILLLGGDGEQGGDPPLLGHHLSHPKKIRIHCQCPFFFKVKD